MERVGQNISGSIDIYFEREGIEIAFFLFLHAGARIAPSSTCVELIAGKDVIRIHGYVRIVPRKNSRGPRRPPTGGLGLVLEAHREGEKEKEREREIERERERERDTWSTLAAVNHGLAKRRKSGPCSNVRRWGAQQAPALRIHVATKQEITAVCKTFVPAGRADSSPLVRGIRHF